MRAFVGFFVLGLLAGVSRPAWSQVRLYIANDDHTDYLWSADENTYQDAFIGQLDYYLGRIQATSGQSAKNQARFNTDGTFWLWEYEHNKTPAEFRALMDRVIDGHIGVPMNPLVSVFGAQPIESVLRGMYYAGSLERRFGFRFQIAQTMENQTMPFGLASLWAGAGAKYSWNGQCGCASQVPFPSADRPAQLYWWTGLDGSRILMKWYRLETNDGLGGYAELCQHSASGIDLGPLRDKVNSSDYPYSIAGGFGRGWDFVYPNDPAYTQTTVLETVAQQNDDVILSNEADFFQDVEATYGSQLPTYAASFGNDWDVLPASMAEVSARVKRAVEKLRAAEALATLVSLQQPDFISGRETARDQAWIDLGLYWEHDWTNDGPASAGRADWQRARMASVEGYCDALYADAQSALAGMIAKTGAAVRFYVFNPLSWTRTDMAEIPYADSAPLHVMDLTTSTEAPSQIVTVSGQRRLRVLAQDVPSLGYKTFEVVVGAGQVFSDAAQWSGGSSGTLENNEWRITVQNDGSIRSWIDKIQSNREFVQNALNQLGSGSGQVTVENPGPVSVTLVANGATPAHTTRITLIRGLRRLAIQNEIIQNFSQSQSWQFSFNLTQPDAWHEEVGAVIHIKTLDQGGHYCPDGNISSYDWQTLNHFVDLSGVGPVGVTLSNADCLFMKLGNSSVSNLDVATPGFSVLAGGQVAAGGLGMTAQDGDNYFLQRFALQNHGAYDPVAAMKFSLEHQNPFVAGVISGGSAYPETTYSLFSISNPNIVAWAVKPAEDGMAAFGMVVRVWNLSDSGNMRLTMPGRKVNQAWRTTHVETPLESVQIQGGVLDTSIAAKQMLTFSIQSSVGSADQVPPKAPANFQVRAVTP